MPEDLVQRELDALRTTVAELIPVEGRPVGPEDTVVVDLVSLTARHGATTSSSSAAARSSTRSSRTSSGMKPARRRTSSSSWQTVCRGRP